MANAIFLAPAGTKVGLTSMCFGLIHLLLSLGAKVGYFKPIEQLYELENNCDKSLELIRQNSNLTPPASISAILAQQLLSQGGEQDLLEQAVGLYKTMEADYDIIIIEGLYSNEKMPFATRLNIEISRAIAAEIVFVASMRNLSMLELNSLLAMTLNLYADINPQKILGCIINHINAPCRTNINGNIACPTAEPTVTITSKLLQKKCQLFTENTLPLLGVVPWNASLSAPRVKDIVDCLQANYLNVGTAKQRRILSIISGATSLGHVCNKLSAGGLLLVPGDRENIIIGACMAALNGLNLAGIILTDGLLPQPNILQLCKAAMTTGLPIITTQRSLCNTAAILETMYDEIALADADKMQATISYLIDCLDPSWLKDRCDTKQNTFFSPPAFRYSLIKAAKAAKKRIVLPEGEEPRIIHAAISCHEKEIAHCVLLGNREKIKQQAELNGLTLPAEITIVQPEDIRHNYVARLMELRKHKGLTEESAMQTLEDPIVVGTMMVELNEVDGLVAGVIHTTANTVRPALRILKTKPDTKIVSSIFFMCLPEQVVVYGDCAVNPNPTAEELADIAIQSADSAQAFGISPKVAMISYSTGTSGAGNDVDKVATATKLAQAKRPDLLIDGPLQYDAAAIAAVAQAKAPNSKVAGQATVFVFPDLNTGNTTYKAVQRNAHVVSIGPMLQGLKKPVNDLSRGALVDDIVFTIALTCIQATQVDNNKA